MRTPITGKVVFLATREVHRRLMGSRENRRHEAELRELIGDVYVKIGRVTRPTRSAAVEAAHALAQRRGWQVHPKGIGWEVRDAIYQREIAELARDPRTENQPGPPTLQDRIIKKSTTQLDGTFLVLDVCQYVDGEFGAEVVCQPTPAQRATVMRQRRSSPEHAIAAIASDLATYAARTLATLLTTKTSDAGARTEKVPRDGAA